MSRLRKLILAPGMSMALLACPAPPAPPASTDAGVVAAKPAEEEVELPKIEGPVAKVNGADIAADKFLHEYGQALKRYKAAKRPVSPSFDTTLRQNIIRRLVEAEVIEQKAAQLNIKVDEPELDRAWQEFKSRYGSEEAFRGFLERAVATEQDLRAQHRLTILRGRVFATVADQAAVDPAEVKAEYDANKARYKLPERVKLSHIFLKAPKGLPPENIAERRKQAEDILKKVKAKGSDFAAIAQEVGEDDTKSRGGDLGFVTRGAMPKPFEDVAFKLKKDQVGIAETDLGIHVVKVTEHESERQQSFDEVKAQIENGMRLRKQNQLKTEAQRKWISEAKIEWILVPEPAAPEFPPASPGAPIPAGQLPPGVTLERLQQFRAQQGKQLPGVKNFGPALKAEPVPGAVPKSVNPTPQ